MIALPVDYNSLDWRQRREVRNQYISEQKGKCQYCGEPLDGPAAKHVSGMQINWRLLPKNFRKYPVHLHHCHDTGMTIGAVHNVCNAVLWQYHGE